VVRRWWYVLVLCPIAAGLLGFAIVQRIPSVYEASETVSVQPTIGADGVPDVQAAQGLADSYAEQIHATPILTAAAVAVGLSSTPATELSAMVQARRLTNTSLVRLTVQAADPALAARFAHAIVATFIDQNSQDEVGRYTSTQNNLVGMLTQLQNEQASRNQQIDALRGQAASPDRDTQIARVQDQVAQLQASQAAAARSLQDLQLASARSGSTLSVVDPAVPPNAPVRPNRRLSVLMAVLAGLLAGVGLVWLLEQMDDRLRDAPSVSRLLQLPTLARIPQAAAALSATGAQDPRVATRFRELRGNVLGSLRAAAPGQPAPTFAITSAGDGDGKSVVAANLAVALARTGRKVTLVDADLGHPAQAAEFKVSSDAGLAALLGGDHDDLTATDCLQPSRIGNLRVLPAGVASAGAGSSDPCGLLLSTRLPGLLEELQRGCDVVIVDTPGLVNRSEGAWLSAHADAVVLVIDARHASKRTIEPALAVLRDAGATLLGVVLNRVSGEPDARGSVFEVVVSRSDGRPAPASAAAAQASTSAGASASRHASSG
jgi:non-specific protein-tyrosine kinase